jgi:hypothetical protein
MAEDTCTPLTIVHPVLRDNYQKRDTSLSPFLLFDLAVTVGGI